MNQNIPVFDRGESFRIWSRPGPVGYLAEPVPSTGPSAFPEIDVTKLEVAVGLSVDGELWCGICFKPVKRRDPNMETVNKNAMKIFICFQALLHCHFDRLQFQAINGKASYHTFLCAFSLLSFKDLLP
ncbi:hypothetical protein RRG08_029519 [Elysia crispata]|uniref:Uncharacterized protein n=1 Tax=Elysia crispata TaxID=231223 RepID=A0AAE0XWA8_9GAST|nr:hypothetical protein RRG08_029519 [Elysia crispata]